MDKRTVWLLATMLVSTSVFSQAYRWVDSDGVVHYSDRPQAGAEKVELPKSNSYSNPRRSTNRPAPRPTANAAQQKQAPERYESFTIASPEPEETLWNIEGVLNVTLVLTPGLKPGHQVRVYFDGQPRLVESASFQIEDVYRGAHNLQAEVVDASGKMVIRSQASRFYVQQNRVAF